jgi:protein TonB
MKLIFTAVLLFAIARGRAQTTNPPPQDTDSIYTKVDLGPEFPGGARSLAGFLNKNIRFPVDAKGHPIQGTVVVRFIVDQQGRRTDEQAISGPEELRQEAVRVIKLSGLWTPPYTNGHMVKAYKQVSIEFKK